MSPAMVVAGGCSGIGLAVDSTHDGRSDCVSQVVGVTIQQYWLASPSFEQVGV